MRQKAQQAADDRAVKHAPPAPGEQTRAEAERREREKIVADDGCPVDGELAADQVVERAEYQTRERAPAAAVPRGEQDDRQHPQIDGAAVRKLIELDQTENFRHGNENGGLADDACLAVFHVCSSKNKKIPAWRAMQASQCGKPFDSMVAFLRRHYPDQVRGIGRQYVTSQPACASAPWIVFSS